MSRRLPIRALLSGAVALALGGGTLLLSQTRADEGVQRAAPDARPVAVTKILVATRSLAPGTIVKSGDLTWRDWPTAALDPAYFAGPSAATHGDFAGSVIRTQIEPGEPITAGRLVTAGSRSALAAITKPGSRAVSVSLTPTSGVSGLIVPGDLVDVVLTYALPRPADGAGGGIERRAATTILGGLRVLAVDQRLAATPADGKDIRNVSLEVTVKQSEVLALAADLGKLSLSLRSLDTTGESRAGESTSTIDYQVARYLPGLSSSAHPRAQGHTPTARLSTVEFHGSKSDGAVPTQ